MTEIRGGFRVGDIVEHVMDASLDHRRIIAVGENWVFLDFQQTQLDAGELPTRLPMELYRVVARPKQEPIDVTCPACQAKPGDRCTMPTNTSRKEVGWFHYPRVDLADEGRATASRR